MHTLEILNRTPLLSRIEATDKLSPARFTWIEAGFLTIENMPIEIEKGHIYVNAGIHGRGYLRADDTNYDVPDTRADELRGDPGHYCMSDEGLVLLKHYEGLKLRAYRCPTGVISIGYGHTKTAYLGQVITENRALKLLYDDLCQFEKAVKRLVQVPISRHEFSALVSYCYNCGAYSLIGTNLLANLNDGLYDLAAAEFTLGWENEPAGLRYRRCAEKILFKTGELRLIETDAELI